MSEDILVLKSSIAMPLAKLPISSHAVKVGSEVILISPLPNIEEFSDAINKFGKVSHIVAPSSFHHLGIKKAKKLFPESKVWGVPALKIKRKDIDWQNLLPTDWPFSEELKAIPIKGMPSIDEVVFYHKRSGSLIVTDLVFNHLGAKGLSEWAIFKLFGTYNRFAVSRLFKKFVVDKKAMASSLEELLELNITQILMAHGEPLTQNPNQSLRAAFEERGLL